jgi:hypothetical protein
MLLHQFFVLRRHGHHGSAGGKFDFWHRVHGFKSIWFNRQYFVLWLVAAMETSLQNDPWKVGVVTDDNCCKDLRGNPTEWRALGLSNGRNDGESNAQMNKTASLFSSRKRRGFAIPA